MCVYMCVCARMYVHVCACMRVYDAHGFPYLLTSYFPILGLFFPPFCQDISSTGLKHLTLLLAFLGIFPNLFFSPTLHLFHTTQSTHPNILLLMLFLIMQNNSFPFVFSQPACIFLLYSHNYGMEYSFRIGSCFFPS